jgi:hypothetical protein
MKVKDLITKLQQCDPEHIVVVDGYETGYDSVDELLTMKVLPAKEKNWYDGEYVTAGCNSMHWLHDEVNVVYLPRKS